MDIINLNENLMIDEPIIYAANELKRAEDHMLIV